MSKRKKMSNRQLATILAALRMWQTDVTDNEDFPAIPVDFGEFFADDAPLNSDEIDELCEQLNCGIVQ